MCSIRARSISRPTSCSGRRNRSSPRRRSAGSSAFSRTSKRASTSAGSPRRASSLLPPRALTPPPATVAVKPQPIHAGAFDVTIGGFGLFYLRGAEDGNPAGQGYGCATYRFPTLQTRISVGGWYASAGYAKPNSTGGALAAFEQPIPWVKGLTLAADWWSGENTIGYLSPGFYWSFGHWTAYAAYTIKNGDSKGDGGLIELGYAF